MSQSSCLLHDASRPPCPQSRPRCTPAPDFSARRGGSSGRPGFEALTLCRFYHLRRLERVREKSCNPTKGDVGGNSMPTISAVRNLQTSAQSALAARTGGAPPKKGCSENEGIRLRKHPKANVRVAFPGNHFKATVSSDPPQDDLGPRHTQVHAVEAGNFGGSTRADSCFEAAEFPHMQEASRCFGPGSLSVRNGHRRDRHRGRKSCGLRVKPIAPATSRVPCLRILVVKL